MSLPYKISGWNRRRKWRLFMDEIHPRPDEKILDVGFNEVEYSATDNFLEKNYPFPDKITALGVDEPVNFSRRYPRVKAVAYNGTVFPFADKSFDIVWSNAVLEHVGDRAAQINFVREIKRVGKRAFFTTPNRRFPVEVHTRTPLLHFLPKFLFDWYLRATGRAWATGGYMNLLSLADLKQVLAAAGVDKYKIIGNRLLGFVLDWVVIF